MKSNLVVAVILTILAGCTPQMKPIEFGFDVCHYCKMTIVDIHHAAEFVTEKGKVFKFDAIECMLQEILDRKSELSLAMTMVCTLDQPEQLTAAEDCTFLISDAIPSPMGAFLSAFSNENNAREAKTLDDDMVMNWQDLNTTFKDGVIRFTGK